MRSLFLTLTLVFSLTACGKKGALYYPDMLVPSAPTATSVSQVGNSVKLQFALPDDDRVGRKLVDLAGVKINKRVIESGQEQVCTSCMTDYYLFRKLYLDLLKEGEHRYGNRIIVLDGDVSAGKIYSYSVVPFTKDGVDGLASPRISVSVVQPAAAPILEAESFPTEIRISFISLPSAAGRFLGYNIYRTTQKDTVPYLPLNREPLLGKYYTDSGLERNVRYLYMARTVFEMKTGNVLESPVSNVVEGMLKDDE